MHAQLHSDCPGSSNPSQQAHTPWPAGWWCLWVHCSGLAPGPCLACLAASALAALDSSPHSAVRDLAIQLSFTFRRQLNSSCTNTYTLSRACINDFMLEPLCGGGSDILRRCSGRCSGGGLMHRNADVGRLFQGHAVVESDGAVPAGPGWTSGSGFWSV